MEKELYYIDRIQIQAETKGKKKTALIKMMLPNDEESMTIELPYKKLTVAGTQSRKIREGEYYYYDPDNEERPFSDRTQREIRHAKSNTQKGDSKPMVIYSKTTYPRIKKSIRNILLGVDSDDLNQMNIRLVPIQKNRALQMQNPFIQDFAETRDIYLVDFCLGVTGRGEVRWMPLVKIAVDPEMVKEAKKNLEQEA